MNIRTKERIMTLFKAAGLTALLGYGLSEPESKTMTEEERIANYQRLSGCTEEQVEQYKRDHVPPFCPPEQER